MELQPLLKVGCAYIRVSDERQDEYSPDSQLKKIREYAAKEGYTIPDEYVFYDDGISGKSVKKRNDFQRMISFAKDEDHPFDVIFVWKFSRFARNQEEAIVYKNLLSKKGISVISVSEPIPEGAFGSLIERIIEWMDQYYLTNLSVEVQRGMIERISRGYPVCPAPYGYRNVDKNYAIVEEEAAIVREVFDRFLQGEAIRAIAVDLGQHGIRTRHKSVPDNRWISYMLQNSTYCGYLRFSTDGSRSVSRRRPNNENVLTVKGHHEPIISEETWNKVQDRLAEQRKMFSKYSRPNDPVTYMLKGLVRCSACGSTLSASTPEKGERYLQCVKYTHGKCRVSHAVKISYLEQAVIQGIQQAMKDKAFTISPEKAPEKKNAPDYPKLVAAEERRLQRARQAYLAEIDSIEQYAVNKKYIEETIAKLKSAMQTELSQDRAESAVLVKKCRDVVRYLKDANVSAEAKNIALRTIIDKVVYNKSDNSVSIYFYT